MFLYYTRALVLSIFAFTGNLLHSAQLPQFLYPYQYHTTLHKEQRSNLLKRFMELKKLSGERELSPDQKREFEQLQKPAYDLVDQLKQLENLSSQGKLNFNQKQEFADLGELFKVLVLGIKQPTQQPQTQQHKPSAYVHEAPFSQSQGFAQYSQTPATVQPLYQAPSQQPQPAQQWRPWQNPETREWYYQDYRTQQWYYQNPTTKEWSYQDRATNQWRPYKIEKQQQYPTYQPQTQYRT